MSTKIPQGVFFGRNWQADSKVYMQRQISQNDFAKEQSCIIHITFTSGLILKLQFFFKTVVLAYRQTKRPVKYMNIVFVNRSTLYWSNDFQQRHKGN